jgi:hypothetical protein
MKDKDKTSVNIKPAKGRPWLHWVGKQPLRRVTAFPAQHIESFTPPAPGVELQDGSIWHDWPASYPRSGLLFHGDNKDVLAHLLANGVRGKVNLVYIDPPFDSGADYVRKVSLRGKTGTAKLDGEGHTLGEQIQYTDIWANDNYLQFMYERLLLLRSLLSDTGVMVLHCDSGKDHLLRSLLDEVFGMERFINEIVWQHAVIGAGRGIYVRLPKAHETLLVYSMSERHAFNTDERNVRVPYKERITKGLSKDDKGVYYTRGRTGTDNPWSKDPRYLRTYVDIAKGPLRNNIYKRIGIGYTGLHDNGSTTRREVCITTLSLG